MGETEKTLAFLNENKNEIAEYVVNKQLKKLDFSELQRQVSLRDARENIEYLKNSIEIDSQVTFNAYILWLRDILRTYGFKDSLLIDHILLIEEYVGNNCDIKVNQIISKYLKNAILSINNNNNENDSSHINECGEYILLGQNYLEALLNFKKDDAVTMILNAVNNDFISVENLYIKVFTNVLYEVGALWQSRKITVGQEHYATAVTQYIMSLLYDKIFTKNKNSLKVIGLCVGDELHEIGVRMVCDIFEINLWDSFYLGANVPQESVLSEIDRIKPNILAISVTIAPKIPVCVALIKSVKLKYPEVKIIVGGRLFNTDIDLWNRIGADGCSNNALEAIEVALNLVGVKNG